MPDKDKKKSPLIQMLEAKKLIGMVFAVSDFVQAEGLITTFGMIRDADIDTENCNLVNQIIRYGGIHLLKGDIS